MKKLSMFVMLLGISAFAIGCAPSEDAGGTGSGSGAASGSSDDAGGATDDGMDDMEEE